MKPSIVLLATLAILTTACTPYRFGAASMYPSSVRTIYIPVPRNDTYRHDLGLQLSESLVREIETHTPFKVIGDASADSVLVCRITGETKSVLTETTSDDPRALDLSVSTTVSWTDRLGNDLLRNAGTVDENGTPVPTGFGADQRFVPEAGQSVGTASIEVADDLAKQIVSQMQVRW